MTPSSDPPVATAQKRDPPSPPPTPDHELERTRITHGLARLVLVTFVLTFIIARILVIAIMAGSLPPQLFFHMQGTHVHHLNYGIILLSISGAISIFARPSGRPLSVVAVLYGMGLALTFDEFGMWLHLGGPYWQRASYDAIIMVGAALALIAYGSTIRHWHPRHHWTIAVLVLALAFFGYLLYSSAQWAGNRVGPLLEQLEQGGPS